MPFMIFKNSGALSWTPADSAIPDGTEVIFHAVGAGGSGGASDLVALCGGGGGGGERRSAVVTITDRFGTYTANVGQLGGGTYKDSEVIAPDTSVIVRAMAGESLGITDVGGIGGTGGTGSAIARDGGNGGTGGSATGGGGGGGAAGRDAYAGNSGGDGDTSGGTGGTGPNELFGASLGAGGFGADTVDAEQGYEYGGGGGGASITNISTAGNHGLIIACWGASRYLYPVQPFVHGHRMDDPVDGKAWMLIL